MIVGASKTVWFSLIHAGNWATPSEKGIYIVLEDKAAVYVPV